MAELISKKYLNSHQKGTGGILSVAEWQSRRSEFFRGAKRHPLQGGV
jgi:hypothetical protein